MTNLGDVKRFNLKRLMAEKKMRPSELAIKYGCKPSYISALKSGSSPVGDDSVVETLPRSLGVDEIEFYSIRHLTDEKYVSADIHRIMLDAKDIIERGDEFLRKQFLTRIKDYKEAIERYADDMGKKEDMDDIKRRLKELEEKQRRKHRGAGSTKTTVTKEGNESGP